MALSREAIIKMLFDVDAVKFGDFKLKSGIQSPIYFNLRVIISFPTLMCEVSELLWKTAAEAGALYSHVCGVPYTALPLATCITAKHDIPMVIRRREAKDYGTKKMIEGVFQDGDTCLIIEDIVTSGSSVSETAQEINNVGMKVKDAVVLIDRGQGGKERLVHEGILLHSVFTIDEVLDVLLRDGSISQDMYDRVKHFISENQFSIVQKPTMSIVPAPPQKRLSYAKRAAMFQNEVAKRLFTIMESKQTNLAFSADVTSCSELLRLADLLGPHICMLKTHVDILTDFDREFPIKLKQLSAKHEFIIFEDRKFADIGNTVKHQYSHGIFNIVEWADMVNAHAVPGGGVVSGLKDASKGYERACVLIAQMSSAGALTDQKYIDASVSMAKTHPDFVIGFISTSVVCDDPRVIHMTPGVNLSVSGDQLGQQYLTPEEVVGNKGCDIIIVGRGIYKAEDPLQAAKEYQQAGFDAYHQSCH